MGFFSRLKESKAISLIRKNAGQHMIDTSAILVCNNPIMGFVENVVIGMPDEVSIKARCIASLVALLGTGSLFSRGRDMSRKAFGVGQASPEKKQMLHDLCYQVGFTAFNLALYRVCGAETKEMISGTLFAVGISAAKGPIKGYAIDTFRDLTGIEESNRLPKYIKSLPLGVKRGIAVAAIVASLATLCLIYKATPQEEQDKTKQYRYELIDNSNKDYVKTVSLPSATR
jgi:hypothetical protein